MSMPEVVVAIGVSDALGSPEDARGRWQIRTILFYFSDEKYGTITFLYS
jgi:hypothetical protein